MEAVGAVPERAAVGHRARGLQPSGTAWDYFPHDHARSRAYRWGEDGLAGICDDQQRLCLALALWNGRDPILKERLFGLTNGEGNHGEDVKELYYYLDATPTHSYLKMLYKYPQREFPYARLVEENRRRGKRRARVRAARHRRLRRRPLLRRLRRIRQGRARRHSDAHHRPQPRPRSRPRSHLLPQLWFRNTWSWKPDAAAGPTLRMRRRAPSRPQHPTLGAATVCTATGDRELLFCENETNRRRLYGSPTRTAYFKDGFHDYVVARRARRGEPRQQPAPRPRRITSSTVPRGRPRSRARCGSAHGDAVGDAVRRLRRSLRAAPARGRRVLRALCSASSPTPTRRRVQRQALAGMLWSKQFYLLRRAASGCSGDPAQPPPPPERQHGRNRDWEHLNNADIISMPDKWEYPWYAAWDLAFHCIPLALIDPEFAKEQLVLLTREWYMHPNGQLPAYEWAFGDVNPPVHAWAAWRVFQIDRKQRGDAGDLEFLERVFHKLMLNFTWWVNRKDAEGRNIFQGGFLGLDNIGVFDRSAPLPTGGCIDQADGTSWMAMYCLNLMRIALELAQHNPRLRGHRHQVLRALPRTSPRR